MPSAAILFTSHSQSSDRKRSWQKVHHEATKDTKCCHCFFHLRALRAFVVRLFSLDCGFAAVGFRHRRRRLVVLVDPKSEPNTPRMISRPTVLPMVRAALLPNVSSKSPAPACQDGSALVLGRVSAGASGARAFNIS
jgi:hypothetical protein